MGCDIMVLCALNMGRLWFWLIFEENVSDKVKRDWGWKIDLIEVDGDWIFVGIDLYADFVLWKFTCRIII